MRKSILIYIIVLMVAIIGGVIWYSLQTRSNDTQSTSDTHKTKISGGEKSPTLSAETNKLIQTSIDSTLTAKHGKGTYTATIRENSYKRIVTPEGGVVTTILIDVKETNETYKFTRTGTDSTEYGTAYVRCASEEDQLTQPSVCKDIAND